MVILEEGQGLAPDRILLRVAILGEDQAPALVRTLLRMATLEEDPIREIKEVEVITDILRADPPTKEIKEERVVIQGGVDQTKEAAVVRVATPGKDLDRALILKHNCQEATTATHEMFPIIADQDINLCHRNGHLKDNYD